MKNSDKYDSFFIDPDTAAASVVNAYSRFSAMSFVNETMLAGELIRQLGPCANRVPYERIERSVKLVVEAIELSKYPPIDMAGQKIGDLARKKLNDATYVLYLQKTSAIDGN